MNKVFYVGFVLLGIGLVLSFVVFSGGKAYSSFDDCSYEVYDDRVVKQLRLARMILIF